MNKLIGIVATITLMATAVAKADDPPKLAVGERFPQLTLPSVEDGKPMSIADYRGKRVVMHVFASW